MSKNNLPHRKRLELCISGEALDRVPVALWRHFPVDDQSAESLAAATIDFQRTYDFDLVKVSPASSFCLKTWGVEDEWQGASEGTRQYTKYPIQNPEDWEKLSVLDPSKGYLKAQLDCLKIIVQELGSEVPVIQTIFNPLSQAKNLVSREKLLAHLRKYPEVVKKGLEIIAISTQKFVEAAKQTGIDGIFYAVQHAQYGLLSKSEYLEFGQPYDRTVLEPASSLWLNMLHLHGEEIMFDMFVDYPMAIINWHDRDTYPSLVEGQKMFKGVVCGGLQRYTTMILGTPETVEAEAKDAIASTGGKRFILGTGCVMPITTPRANIMAARRSVE